MTAPLNNLNSSLAPDAWAVISETPQAQRLLNMSPVYVSLRNNGSAELDGQFDVEDLEDLIVVMKMLKAYGANNG